MFSQEIRGLNRSHDDMCYGSEGAKQSIYPNLSCKYGLIVVNIDCQVFQVHTSVGTTIHSILRVSVIGDIYVFDTIWVCVSRKNLHTYVKSF